MKHPHKHRFFDDLAVGFSSNNFIIFLMSCTSDCIASSLALISKIALLLAASISSCRSAARSASREGDLQAVDCFCALSTVLVNLPAVSIFLKRPPCSNPLTSAQSALSCSLSGLNSLTRCPLACRSALWRRSSPPLVDRRHPHLDCLQLLVGLV